MSLWHYVCAPQRHNYPSQFITGNFNHQLLTLRCLFSSMYILSFVIWQIIKKTWETIRISCFSPKYSSNMWFHKCPVFFSSWLPVRIHGSRLFYQLTLFLSTPIDNTLLLNELQEFFSAFNKPSLNNDIFLIFFIIVSTFIYLHTLHHTLMR